MVASRWSLATHLQTTNGERPTTSDHRRTNDFRRNVVQQELHHARSLGLSVALGAAMGAALGAATGHVALWVAIGIAAYIAITLVGGAWDSESNK
jgi:uncharacterized membrane protein YoaK (UPF0700 family)